MGPQVPLMQKEGRRLTETADIAAAAKVEESAFGDKAETAPTLYVVSRVGDLHGVKVAGELAAAKSIIYDREGNAMSMSTSVHKERQGMGAGTMLAKMMEEAAVKNHANTLFALVPPNNGPQLSSYMNKQGWEVDKVMPDFYGPEGDFGLGGDRFLVAKRIGRNKPAQPLKVPVSDLGRIGETLDDGYIGFGLMRDGLINSLTFGKAEPAYKNDKKTDFTDSKEVVAAQALESQHFDPPSSVFFLRSMEKVGRVLAAREDGKLTGFSGVIPSPGFHAYIHGPIAAPGSPEFSGLLTKAEEEARSMDAKIAWTIAPDSDKPRAKALEDAGYKSLEEAEGLYNGSKLIRYGKRLT